MIILSIIMDRKAVNQITFYMIKSKKISSVHIMNSEPQISVIIPILAGDDCWKSLITDLVHFPDSSEFLFISSGDQPREFPNWLTAFRFMIVANGIDPQSAELFR